MVFSHLRWAFLEVSFLQVYRLKVLKLKHDEEFRFNLEDQDEQDM
jgi:hypothetical protein